MALLFRENGEGNSTPDLPALGSLVLPNCSAKDKIQLVLRLLRQAATERRGLQGQPFYSIRAVAANFSLPPTTVTRLYGRLRTEGVLGSIWGSKTIVEPLEIDRDIRLKSIVGLPVSLSAFSVSPGYRRFFHLMQRALWKHRFGSQLVFHENGFPESPRFTETLIDYRTDAVVWLTPSSRASSAIARLKDRGIKAISVVDGMPINGEPGYYISRQNAVTTGLAAWQTAGVRSVVIVHEDQWTSPSKQRMVQAAVSAAGIPCTWCDISATTWSGSSPRIKWRDSGVIFASAQSVIRFANKNISGLLSLLRENRVMFLEGDVDLPTEAYLNGSFDSIEFDWRAIARRLVSDLVANGSTANAPEQSIFKAKWRGAIRQETIAV
jgi:hypothetical protein